ncbi:MAG: hypothetical protein ACK5IJ_04305 [Mangrovibacterium sp.]
MKQKDIWMLLLAIGIVSSLMSCNTIVDGGYILEFRIINNTEADLSIAVFNKSISDSLYYQSEYNISKNDTLIQEYEPVFGSTLGLISFADSVEIIFGNTRKVSFGEETESPFNVIYTFYNNYIEELIPQRRSINTYTFTEEDYNNALPIEDGEE